MFKKINLWLSICRHFLLALLWTEFFYVFLYSTNFFMFCEDFSFSVLIWCVTLFNIVRYVMYTFLTEKDILSGRSLVHSILYSGSVWNNCLCVHCLYTLSFQLSSLCPFTLKKIFRPPPPSLFLVLMLQE